MSWAVPVTWATGDMVTAGMLNAHLNADANWLLGTGSEGFVGYDLHGQAAVNKGAWAVFGVVSWDPTGFIADWIKTHALPIIDVPTPLGYSLAIASTDTDPDAAGSIWTQTITLYDVDTNTSVRSGKVVPGIGAAWFVVQAAMLIRSVTVGSVLRVALEPESAATWTATYGVQLHQLRGL